jgi:hypothetical protein
MNGFKRERYFHQRQGGFKTADDEFAMYRRLIAKKFDGSIERRLRLRGRPGRLRNWF